MSKKKPVEETGRTLRVIGSSRTPRAIRAAGKNPRGRADVRPAVRTSAAAMAEFEENLRRFASHVPADVPPLSDDAMSAASIYRED